jgi:hypothetical protein
MMGAKSAETERTCRKLEHKSELGCKWKILLKIYDWNCAGDKFASPLWSGLGG